MAGLKARDADLREVVMTDVCPYSLGIEISHELGDGRHVAGQFSPIIERNTVVPVSRVRDYEPTQDGQEILQLSIYQGESRAVRDNIRIGELRIPLDRGTRAENAVAVRFTYDVNGILEVEATRIATGEMHRIVIRSHASELTDQQIAERFAALAELKVHPRDKLENRSVMAEAERVYAFLRGHARETMGNEITHFEAALNEQQPRGIESARTRLRRAIDHFDRYNVFDTDPDPL